MSHLAAVRAIIRTDLLRPPHHLRDIPTPVPPVETPRTVYDQLRFEEINRRVDVREEDQLRLRPTCTHEGFTDLCFRCGTWIREGGE